MNTPIQTEWYPEEHFDEVMPDGRASPSAWIVNGPNGELCLAEFHGAPGDPLTVGDVIPFVSCERYGSAILTIDPDGSWRVSRPMPPEARQCCIGMGWNIDTIASSVGEAVDLLKNADGMGDLAGNYIVLFYTYSDAINYVFNGVGFSSPERSAAE